MTPEFEERLVLAIMAGAWSVPGHGSVIDCKKHWNELRRRAAEGDVDMAAAVYRYRAQALAAFAVCHAQRSMIC